MSGKLVATWTSRKGAHSVRLFHVDGTYYHYRGEGSSGAFHADSLDAAIAAMQSRIDHGGYQPDRNKTPMVCTRVESSPMPNHTKYETLRTSKTPDACPPATVPTVADILRYEDGEMDEAETVEFFRALRLSGMLFSLQGHYGRAWRYLHDAGYDV
jgi:hypothetical protein